VKNKEMFICAARATRAIRPQSEEVLLYGSLEILASDGKILVIGADGFQTNISLK
jgi:hypothetical protein